MPLSTIKRYIILFLIYSSAISGVLAQKDTPEVQSFKNIIQSSYVKDTVLDHKDLLRYTAEIYATGKLEGSSENMLYALLEQSRIYFTDSHFSILLKRLEEGIRLSKEQSDYNMLCRFLLIYQKYLWQFDYVKESTKILNKCEAYNALVKEENDRRINHVFIMLSKADANLNNEGLGSKMGTVIALKKKAYAESLKIKNADPLKTFTIIYTLQSLSWSCALSKHLDEAKGYIQEAEKLLISNPNNYLYIDIYKTKGAIENIERNHEVALKYLTLAIDKAEKTKNLYKLYEITPMISASYGELNDYKKAAIYSWKGKHLSDSIHFIKRKTNDNHLITQINDRVFKEKESFHSYLILFFPITLLATTYYFFDKRKRSKILKNNALLPGNESDIKDANALLVNPETIEKLVLLAKENSATFYIEFHKVYPDFYTVLIQNYPDLNNQDINFCSLIKLNFSVKEIALYTNSSIRSAENRRFRIRKKMNLESQNELYLTLSKIDQ